MIVVMRFEFDDETRRALRVREGRRGLATREDIKSYISTAVNGLLEDVMHEYFNIKAGRSGNAPAYESEEEE